MKTALKATFASVVLLSAAGVVAEPAAAGGLFDRNGSAGSTKDFGHVPVRSSSVGRCYIRGDVGYAAYNEPDITWPVNNLTRVFDTDPQVNGGNPVASTSDPQFIGSLISETSTFAGDDVRNASLDDTFFGEVGIGCGSGSRGFRAEVTLGFRGSQDVFGEPNEFSVTEVFPVRTAAPVNPDDPLNSSLRTYTLMFNGFYDIGKFGRFVPYVGVGVGVAYHRLDEVFFTENTFLTNRIEGNNDLTFAWSLMAGTAYQISDRAVLDVGYRYLDLGRISSGRADNGGFVNPAVNIDDITSHEVKVGLRYHFGGGEAAPPPSHQLFK